ncbi:UDP-4-amino-4,6-dideoxy-N-acetyl-beta-L-altrosamine transaminase [Magnetovibrio sp. PR-2]|uniref:UDP-4-amino-4, 6-dideoxy-N-acetyl-beta-L-altrosamine transaminase n=1 Tax=Magnetovibrio sp. PR-2 TaxID=3120356 RepID=UPI002FCE4B1E
MTSNHKFLSYGRHYVDEADRRAVEDVLRGDWLTQGQTVTRFEEALAERVGAKYAISVTSGTAALHIAMLASGMSPRDVSLTSAFTFVASANAALYCGADSDLGDIDIDTLCLSNDAVAAYVDKSSYDVKTIVPVHYGGLSVNVGALKDISPKSIIIEDASHSLGGDDEQGRPIGSCADSDMAIFSFHPVKPITTGDGGMVTTNDKELYKRLLQFKGHGIVRGDDVVDIEQASDGIDSAPWYYEQQVLGYNYRMTDIQAALGLSQLGKLDTFTKRRREIAKYYDQCFGDLIHMRPAQNRPEYRERSSHHLYVGLFDFEGLGCTKTQFMKKLRADGVGTQVHYIPVYRHPYHRKRLGDVAEHFPGTEQAYNQALSLPIFPSMRDEDVEHVVKVVRTHTGAT